MSEQKIRIDQKCGYARRGLLHLDTISIETPAFMPVGTYGAIKGMTPRDLRQLGYEMILANSYHLYLRPGLEIFKKFGNIHKWMRWDGGILTDSGGYQIFSLGNKVNLTDDGVYFRSTLDGSTIHLRPEDSALIQATLGSNIAMVLDECVALPASQDTIERAIERSYRWAKRFIRCERPSFQRVFGIVQGGTVAELRLKSLHLTLELDIDGVAIGGLSVGETHEEMVGMLKFLAPNLPEHLPRYLMGVGTPRDILEAINCGIDMFDCVLPTRNARHGAFFTDNGLVRIKNRENRLSDEPIDPNCKCSTCQHFSRSYLRHLFLTKEILGCHLATIHNLHYYQAFIMEIRQAIENGTFPLFYERWSKRLKIAYPDDYEKKKFT